MCEHSTKGPKCDQCLAGYYGVPSKDTSEFACQPCPCSIVSDPETGILRNGRCEQSSTSGEVMCVECPKGYTGQNCSSNSEAYYQNFSFWFVDKKYRQEESVICDCK